jgi:hypothetical protein
MNYTSSCVPPADATLRLILERCAEDSIDEERVQRVLAPVLQMIQEGRFRKRKRPMQPAKPLAIAAALVLTTVGIARFGGQRGALTESAPPPVPLGDAEAISTTLAGRLMGKSARLGGVTLALTAEDGEVIGTATTDEDGCYCFTNIPDGAYVLTVATPGLALEEEAATVAVTSDRDTRKDIELWVYETAK